MATKDRTTGAQLMWAATGVRATIEERNRLIRLRAEEGASLRQIAAEAGLSHTAVANILQSSAQS